MAQDNSTPKEEALDGYETVSDIDSDDGKYIEEESILERIAALVDIVPPMKRQQISSAVSSTVSKGLGIGKVIGNGLWVLTTGALLVLLPVGLELERDAMAIQQEFQGQSSQQQ